MQMPSNPVVGNWYRLLDSGATFSVVAIDDAADAIEVQYFDGDIDEFERDEWYELNLEAIDEPEDFSGSLDVDNVDDLGGTNVTDTESSDWRGLSREEPLRDLSGSEVGARETASEGNFDSDEERGPEDR